MNASLISVETYLTVQILEIIGYGPLHALTWARRTEPNHWLQVSVHRGDSCHLMVQCVLPEGMNRRSLDAAFNQVGWTNLQADRNDCLVYYLARSGSYEELCERAPEAARQCAKAIYLLWGVASLEELALLGARGPRLTLHRSQASADASPAQAIAA
jgi:hypothetical protein